MSSRTVRFSDILTSPFEFAPIQAPPSPSSQLETLSSTDSSSSDVTSGGPSPQAAADAPSTSQGLDGISPVALEPRTQSTSDSALASSPQAPLAGSASDVASGLTPSPVAPPAPLLAVEPSSASSPEVAMASASSALASAAVPETASSSQEPPAPSIAPQAPLGPPEALVPPRPSSALGSPPIEVAQAPAIQTVPPLPTGEPPGSPFNLPGLEAAFPVKPTGLGGVSILSATEAAETTRRLGLRTDLSVPRASRLADGSLLLSAPTTAVSLAHISASCAEALGSAATQQLVRQTLGLIAAFRHAPQDEGTAMRLAEALQALKRAQLQTCDAALGAAIEDARNTFGKLRLAAKQRTAAEMTHLRHAEEFRALKRDLRALGDVVRADAHNAAGAREKLVAFKRQALPKAATTLAFIAARLGQVQDLAQRVR